MATKPCPRLVVISGAKALTRACLFGTILEPLNPTLYFQS